IIESLLTITREEITKHSKVCQDPNTCSKSKNLSLSEFFLVQELEVLGVETGQEIFDASEQSEMKQKLDDILYEIAHLKMGQEIIYEDIKTELEELKSLFYLSKKNWKQLLLGKVIDMTIAGLISETISKQILELLQNDILKFISA
ncbi:MAG: hypothetical protein HQ541_08485, partial [Mariniphaga sp.]|nr:hypothetical protein [Mariniphaga sp.]